MGIITSLLEFFLLAVAFGVGLFTFLADPKATGGGFLKLIASVCLGSGILALGIYLAGSAKDISIITLYIVGNLSLLFTYRFQQDHRSLMTKVSYLIHNLSFLMITYLFSQQYGYDFVFIMSSLLFLGVVTYLMLMGHWYLVTPKLSEKPLAWGLMMMWGIFFFKVIWTSIGFYESGDYFMNHTQLGGGFSFNWMMFLMRVLWGYVVIGGMSYFGWRLVRMRSIQSATGIFYAMTFFVFVGELISLYLHFKYGLLI